MQDDSLSQVQKELEAREPIFHRAEFGTSRADFDAMMTDDFFEVGASGRRYSREFVLNTLVDRHRESVTEALVPRDFECHRLCEDLYLLHYILPQPERLTRRTSLWRCVGNQWKVVFHQGTIVQDVIATGAI